MSKAQRLKARGSDLTIPTNIGEGINEERETKHNREDECSPISDGKRDVYGLDTLQVMGAAFDTAVQLLPPNLKDHERTRRRLCAAHPSPH